MSDYNNIYYAVITLTKTQADEVISKLKEEGMGLLANWLEDNKDIIYGDLLEDWRPFKDEKIIDIIDKRSKYYKSETHLIDMLNEDCTNVAGVFSRTNLFFIDVFAMYIEKFAKFATRADLSFSKNAKCCFLINYALPTDVQIQLEKTYKETWPSVSEAYNNGSLHRIAVRVDDVKNFKNYLKVLLATQDRPNPINLNELLRTLGPAKPLPNLGE